MSKVFTGLCAKPDEDHVYYCYWSHYLKNENGPFLWITPKNNPRSQQSFQPKHNKDIHKIRLVSNTRSTFTALLSAVALLSMTMAKEDKIKSYEKPTKETGKRSLFTG